MQKKLGVYRLLTKKLIDLLIVELHFGVLQISRRLRNSDAKNWRHSCKVETPVKKSQTRRFFPRFKGIAVDTDEILSIDLALVEKLAKYDTGVNYPVVAVVLLSRCIRVSPR